MEDVDDIDPLGDYDKTDTHPDETGENIPLTCTRKSHKGTYWEPMAETSFRGKTQNTRLMESKFESLYEKLSTTQKKVTYQNPEVIHSDYFELRGKSSYFKDKKESLTRKDGRLRETSEILRVLDKEGLRDLGFEIVMSSKIAAQQAIALNRVEEELPSVSDVAKADNIELQKITENTARSTEDLSTQLQGEFSEDLHLHELLGLVN